MTNLTDIKKRIETALDQVRAAAMMLSKDQSIDMTGLEELVGSICRDVTGLKQSDRDQFKNDMINLTDEVTHLTNALIAQQEAIKKALDDTRSHTKAAKAYGTKKSGS